MDRDKQRNRVWLIDEIGFVKGWSARLKLLRDGSAVGDDTVVATSSSWRPEENVQGNLLAGRAGRTGMRRVRLLLPISFRDYLAIARPDLPLPELHLLADLQPRNAAQSLEDLRFDLDDYDFAWQDYLSCGGFPRAVAHALRAPGADPDFVRDLAAFLRTDIDKDAPPELLPRLLAGLEQRSTSP